MRILVTGGTGFVGRHVCAECSRAGHDMVHVVISESECSPGVQGVVGDIRAPDTLPRAIEAFSPDACLHLAGIAFVPRSWEKPHETFDVNLNGTVHLLEAFRNHAPKARILAVTSSLVYGSQPHPGHELNEDDSPEPDSPYAVSKLAADWTCRLYAQRYGMPVMSARPCNHIGPGQSEEFVIPSFTRQLLRIRDGAQEPVLKVGNLDSIREFLDVRDVARAYRMLLERGQPGEAYNIASGQHLPIRDVLNRLIHLIGVNPEVIIDPARYRPSDIQPHLSIQKIQRDVGWEPQIGIDQSLQDILAEMDGP